MDDVPPEEPTTEPTKKFVLLCRSGEKVSESERSSLYKNVFQSTTVNAKEYVSTEHFFVSTLGIVINQ